MVGAMDSQTIRQLRNEWRALGSSGAARTACHRLAECEPVIARLDVDDLAELVTALSPSSAALSRNEAAAVIAAMLKSAAIDPLIPRAIIQALVPGILGLARQLDGTAAPWGDLDTFYGDAISCLFEQITTWSGTLRPYAAGETCCPGSAPSCAPSESAKRVTVPGVSIVLMGWTPCPGRSDPAAKSCWPHS
jgi:hypothetical protein